MNFFKKNKEIEIITPLEGNLDVQAFAEQYAKAGTVIEVKVHGSLYQSDGNMVSVRFITKEKWETIVEHFMRKFSTRRPTVGNRFMFCH